MTAELPRNDAALFTPLSLRQVTSRNRVVISPMCQYSARDGFPTDWHFANLAQFANGGAGIVFVEASAVLPEGRITYGDLGIWSDAHGEALVDIVNYLHQRGALAAIQLGHAGRKASMQRPWEGNGPLDETQIAAGEEPWEIVAPSAEPAAPGWLVPKALDEAGIERILDAFAKAAQRADAAGFDIIELHGAHGYLLHSFLSPLSNLRTDRWGGDRRGRMGFLLEVVRRVRAAWPAGKPLFVRLSCVDGAEGGWDMADTLVLAEALKALGVDVIDCSSGGIAAASSPVARGLPRAPGFQVPFASEIRRKVGIATQAVGLITEPEHANAIITQGDADLVAIARQALFDPFWAHHAADALGADPQFEDWPTQYGWWLTRRAAAMAAAGKSTH